jgi:hypothetical protein
MIQNINELIALIDVKLAILIIISSYWVKANFSHIKPGIPIALKIFIWSTVLSLAYYFIGKKVGYITNESLIDLLITYFAATSFYEVFFKTLEKAVKSIAGGAKK